MSIKLTCGEKRFDWAKVSISAAEAAVQAVALGKFGLGNPIPSFFKTIEALKGDDDVSRRSMKLVMETLAYAFSKSLARCDLRNKASVEEIDYLIKSFLDRYSLICDQEDIYIDLADFDNPNNFTIFSDAAGRIYEEIKVFSPSISMENIKAIFREEVSIGLSRIRARDNGYYSHVFDALKGSFAQNNSRHRAWSEYKEKIIKRFDDHILFAQDEDCGVTLGQVYQPLRAWWVDEKITDRQEKNIQKFSVDENDSIPIQIGMLEDIVMEWLEKNDRSDRIKLVSGGPGSGKSSFARKIAATLSLAPRWRVLVVPLQRLKGGGSIDLRIEEYFRSYLDEPFDADTTPLSSLGRDNHQDWIIIFDGLDELAKEGAGSETAAQEFASALIDWKSRIGDSASVRFIVLGRAPSMQEASKRLSLHGNRTLHVADMRPFKQQPYRLRDREVIDVHNVADLDQRKEFWLRYAIAAKQDLDVPAAMTEESLSDLTKEPLLAYLLIISGYVGSQWEEAANNRNHIYESIFGKIWERERIKETRRSLNEMGRETFDTLMQSLGIAAWRGGGRTGDEATFVSMRDVFMRPDLLKKAKNCGAADLDNVAILFYTRKDEELNRGYEFLHKSFGEYLTACGLLDAFMRWGQQVADPYSDFDHRMFLSKWVRLTAAAPITVEIVAFLINQAEIIVERKRDGADYEMGRKWVGIAASLINYSLEKGIDYYDEAGSWRNAEIGHRNAEIALWAVMNAFSKIAYPTHLFNADISEGGWKSGPIKIDYISSNPLAFDKIARNFTGDLVHELQFSNSNRDYVSIYNNFFVRFLERVNFDHSQIISGSYVNFFAEGASFRVALIAGASFFVQNMSLCDFTGASIENTKFAYGELNRTNFEEAIFENNQMYATAADKCSFKKTRIVNCALRRVEGEIVFKSSMLRHCDITGTVKTSIYVDESDLYRIIMNGSNIMYMKISKSFADDKSRKKIFQLFKKNGWEYVEEMLFSDEKNFIERNAEEEIEF